jgi:hypothetical protein
LEGDIMAYDQFFKGLKSGDIRKIEEDVNTWIKTPENEKAAIIQEVKLAGNMKHRSYLQEISEKAKTKANTEAGGSGDQTGTSDKVDSKEKSKEATVMTDRNPEVTKIAVASGIGSGLGAMYLAKKLRRTQAAS